MQEITVKAPAKLNLALDIVGTDGRGYHLMKMVMQTIGLYDTITVQKQPEGHPGRRLSCPAPIRLFHATSIISPMRLPIAF